MKSSIQFQITLFAFATLSNGATASVHFTNDQPGYVAKVDMYTVVDNYEYGATTFSCEHYLHFGESLDFEDQPPCTYSVTGILWIQKNYTILVSGRTEVATGCTVTYSALLNPNSGMTLYWFKNGDYLGTGTTRSITYTTTGSYTITVSDRYTLNAPDSIQSQTTVTAIDPTPPPSMGWGVFDVVCPPISGKIISTSGPPWILGRTRATLNYKCKPNIDCSGAFDSIGARVTITEYVYDSRINNAADIAAISNAEAQHVQVWATMVNNIGSRTENGRRESSYAAATATTGDWETNVIQQEVSTATNLNAAYDQPGGQHPTLGNSIVSHGGFTP